MTAGGFGARATALGVIVAMGVSGCMGRLDHLGRAPTMSPVDGSREAIDPSLPQPDLGGGGGDPIEGVGADLADQLADVGGGGDGGRGWPGEGGAIAGPAGAASLWSSGPGSLFGDRRARTVGDIMTVIIEIDDSASFDNSTSRERSGEASVGAVTAFGLETVVDRIIPGDAVSLQSGVDASGSTSSEGAGQIQRGESLSLRIAVTVVDVLPNGHLLIYGSQEVRLNNELRDLQIAGVIRPEDITRENTITYDKIANARISYGGRGQLSDVQQPGLGQQVVDAISPF